MCRRWVVWRSVVGQSQETVSPSLEIIVESWLVFSCGNSLGVLEEVVALLISVEVSGWFEGAAATAQSLCSVSVE